MDNDDTGQDENNISSILTLPEEAMREIFNYLSFETLYFSLRTVCKNIHTYVHDYLKIRETSFFASCQRGLEKEVIEITEIPKKGFILLRSPESTIPWVTSKLQNNEIIDDRHRDERDRDRLVEMVFHEEKYQSGVCQLHMSEKISTFRYDLENEMWERLLENCTPLEWLDHKETSHEFIQMAVSEIITQEVERRSSRYTESYPFLLVIAKDKYWSVGKVVYCKCIKDQDQEVLLLDSSSIQEAMF